MWNNIQRHVLVFQNGGEDHVYESTVIGQRSSFYSSKQHKSMGLRKASYIFIVIALITIALAILLSSASAQQANTSPETKSHEVSGFLGDYTGLFPVQDNGDLMLYVREKGILKNYEKFIVDPVTIYLLPEAQGRALDPDDLRKLAYDCRQALVDELQGSDRYKVVTDPGPGVLHLRAALTDG
jgi:hypothetical protein